MKRFLIAIVAVWAMLCGTCHKVVAQRQYVGVKGGYGLADVRLYPHWTSPPLWGVLNGGIFWVYYGGDKPNSYLYDNVAGGISLEVEFMQRGFQYAALDRNTERYTYGRRINSIMVPLMWQPHVLLADDRLRLYLNAGITGSFNLDSTEFYIDNETGKIEEHDYEWMTVRDNRFAYGLVVGLGGGWSFGKWELMGEFRYYFGYSDITKRKTIYAGTQFLRSPIDNINLSLGVAYHWNHSGSWSWSPKQRTEARRAKADLEALANSHEVITEGAQEVQE